MLITRTSQATGVTRTMDLPVTEEQIVMWATTSALIQDVFPNLTADQREFIVSGMTEDEWEQIFGEYEQHHYERDSVGTEFDDLPF
jgi:hypothetical protein